MFSSPDSYLPLLPCYLSQVQYYGLIKQATGEDWKDAKISLSTAQPSIGGSAPPLPTRIIRFKRPPARIMPLIPSSMRSRAYYDEYDPTIEDSYDEFGARGLVTCYDSYSAKKTRKRFISSSISPPPSPPALNIEVAQVIEGYWGVLFHAQH